MANEQCPKCSSPLFIVEPFRTTQQEIIEFARRSSLSESEKQSIIQSKWMHPGYYCPNGCTRTFVEIPLSLPAMTTHESIAIAAEYAKKHLSIFIQTHGITSRIMACVFCEKFQGTVLQGEPPTSIYRQPKLNPFRNKKVASAYCSDPRIQQLRTEWWYSIGKTQAECDYFEFSYYFRWVYKDVTGWSEYPIS